MIGILGGMGPRATARLFSRLIELSKATVDRDYPRCVVLSDSSIPSRGRHFELGEESPAAALAQGARILECAQCDLIVVGCLSAHAFLSEIRAAVDIAVIDACQETASRLAAWGAPSAAVLGTPATLYHGPMSKRLASANVSIEPISEGLLGPVRKVIELVKAGEDLARAEVMAGELSDRLRLAGVRHGILGCSELPELTSWSPDIRWVDPMDLALQAALEMDASGPVPHSPRSS